MNGEHIRYFPKGFFSRDQFEDEYRSVYDAVIQKRAIPELVIAVDELIEALKNGEAVPEAYDYYASQVNGLAKETSIDPVVSEYMKGFAQTLLVHKAISADPLNIEINELLTSLSAVGEFKKLQTALLEWNLKQLAQIEAAFNEEQKCTAHQMRRNRFESALFDFSSKLLNQKQTRLSALVAVCYAVETWVNRLDVAAGPKQMTAERCRQLRNPVPPKVQGINA